MKQLIGYLVFLSVWVAPPVLTAQDFDVVVLNGRVMDPETGFDEVANVGISNGWIVAITKDKIKGRETIDASGHVVAPGFIDTEQHGLTDWGIKVNLRDGVTTQMDFEVGALNISEWYAKRAGKLQANYGTVVGQEFARMRVHDGLTLDGPDVSMPYFFDFRAEAAKDGVDGWSVTRSSTEQMNQITKTLDDGLREGALGVGSTIGYAQLGITTYEMLEAQRAAARYGRLTAVHHRFHPNAATPTEGPTGANEIIVNAMLLDAPLQIHHNNDYGWWEIEEKTQLARKQGYNIWSTWYPWDAGSGNAGASILAPATWETAMGYKYEETIYDPQNDKYLTKEEFLKLAGDDPGYMLVAFSPPRQEWMKEWIKLPDFVIAGDGMPTVNNKGEQLTWDSPFEDYAGHPRSAGTHAKVLRLGREANVPLMHTLSQLSFWTAKHLADTGIKAMHLRGRLQEGMVADITIFDPTTVTEHAEYKAGKNGLASTGIPYVLVHGQLVVKDSKVLKGVTPGQPIRFPVEKTGRFVPATKKMWLQTHTIDSSGVAPPASSIKKEPTRSDQSSYKATGDSSERFWWGDHRRINDFAGYCCDLHRIMADYAVTDSSKGLSHTKVDLAVNDARSGADLEKLNWNEFVVSYSDDSKNLTIQQKHDVEAVAKSQVLNDLYSRRQRSRMTSEKSLMGGAFEESLIKARVEASKARARLKTQGINADELLKNKKNS